MFLRWSVERVACPDCNSMNYVLVFVCDQLSLRPASMSHETYCWMLLQDFVDKYEATTFNATDLMCVDKSMSHWYGLGGVWKKL
jgi:hypothetical protein